MTSRETHECHEQLNVINNNELQYYIITYYVLLIKKLKLFIKIRIKKSFLSSCAFK